MTFDPIEEWPETNSHPLVFDDSLSYLEKVARLRASINTFIEWANGIDEQFIANNAWVQGIKDWFDAEITRIEAAMVATAVEQITPVVQEHMPEIFAPFEAGVTADLDAQREQIAANLEAQTDAVATIRDDMLTSNVALRADLITQTEMAIANAKQPIYNDILALVLALISSIGGGTPTNEDVTPPAVVTDLAVEIGDKLVNLSWTNPTDADFNSVMIRRGSIAPATVTDGDLVYVGNITSYQDTNLTNDTEYHYSIFTFDNTPNFSAPVSIAATPTRVPIIWSFDKPTLSEQLVDMLPLTSGVGSIQSNRPALQMNTWNAANSAGLTFLHPVEKGRTYEAVMSILPANDGGGYSEVGFPEIEWGMAFGFTKPLTSLPTQPLSRDDITIGVDAFFRQRIGYVDRYHAYYLNPVYRNIANGEWKGLSGTQWADNFFDGSGAGNGTCAASQRKVTIETTLEQFRIRVYDGPTGAVCAETPWTNFSSVLHNENEGEIYVYFNTFEVASGTRATFTGQSRIYYIKVV